MNIVPYFVTAASIVGTVANSFQKRWCFYVWLCTNAFWCVFNAINGSYAQALLYAFNFAMAILGLVKWRRNEKRSKSVKLLEELRDSGKWIKCNSPLGHIAKCHRRHKTAIDCKSCKYGEIYDEKGGLKNGLQSNDK